MNKPIFGVRLLMSKEINFLITETLGLSSVTQFLTKSCQSKNLLAIKKLHARLLTTGLLFVSLNIHAQLIFSYTTCLANTDTNNDKSNLKTLTNCLNFINPKNPIPFNSLLTDFSRNGFALPALKTMSLMHKKGVSLDSYALCSTVIACTSCKDLNFGRQLHGFVLKSGWLCSVYLGSALIDFYAKLSLVRDSAVVFDEIPVKNTVCVNALLLGYAEAKLWLQGLELIREVPSLNLEYDHFTLSAILRSCTGLCAIELGKQAHAYITRRVHYVENDVFLQSSLIEMYGKCGLVEKALQVFSFVGFASRGDRNRDIVLWTSMIGAYSRNGQFNEVIELFEGILEEGIEPDKVAFLTVISACRDTGQVELGIKYFELMAHGFKLIPGSEHYSCVVDMLCRAGELDKALTLVNEMDSRNQAPSISLWGALLSACAERCNLELGQFAAEQALVLEPHNDGIHVMLSNLYAKFNMWDEIGKLRESMKQQGLKKDVGRSWTESAS